MSSASPPATNPRFPLFDSLRGLAALSVFVVHVPLAYKLTDSFLPYRLALNVGVPVFFLISGFLLYRPYAQARYSGTAKPATAGYALRRASRIVPAYWLALPLVVLLLGPSGEAATADRVFTAHGVVAYFGFGQIYDSGTLLGGISAAWTLCVEVTFYALLPLWALLLRRFSPRSPRSFLRSELTALSVLFALGLAWNVLFASVVKQSNAAFLDPTKIEPWLHLLPAYLDHFALGMALAVLSVAAASSGRPVRVVRLISRAPWVPWLGCLVAYAVMVFLAKHLSRDTFPKWYVGNHVMQAAFALGLLLPAIFGDERRGFVRKILANRVLLWLGLVSYGLYLWHAAVMSKLVALGALRDFSGFAFVCAALVLSLLVAALSFYLVERPALRLSRLPGRASQNADARARDLARHEQPEEPPVRA